VPWNHYNNPTGWQSFITQLQRQSAAFAQAQQTLGVPIQQRIIVLSSKAPEAFHAAQQEILAILNENYQEVFWGNEEFETLLQGLQ